jgi:hypothetical protein
MSQLGNLGKNEKTDQKNNEVKEGDFAEKIGRTAAAATILERRSRL